MKPLTALLAATVFLFSCQKATENDGNHPVQYYFNLTINGISYQQGCGNESQYMASSYIRGSVNAEYVGFVGPDSLSTQPDATYFAFGKGLMPNFLSASNEDFLHFYAPGKLTYVVGPDANIFQNGNGVWLSWIDRDGQGWYSWKGDQKESSFEILSREEMRDDQNRLFVKVKARFNCKLYKQGISENMQQANGEFTVLIRRF